MRFLMSKLAQYCVTSGRRSGEKKNNFFYHRYQFEILLLVNEFLFEIFNLVVIPNEAAVLTYTDIKKF